MNHNEVLYKNEQIHTERLILRKFKVEDAADILEYAADKEVTKSLSWEGLTTIKAARTAVYDYYWSRPGIWAIEHKESAKMIGCIDLRLKPNHNKAAFGFVLNKNFWGRGLMTEALSAIINLCFNELKLNRVEARHFADNPASGRVMEKAGMQKEGFAEKGELVKGEYKDIIFYGIAR